MRRKFKTPLKTRLKNRARGKIRWQDKKVADALKAIEEKVQKNNKRKATPEDFFFQVFRKKPKEEVVMHRTKGGVMFVLQLEDYMKFDKPDLMSWSFSQGQYFPRGSKEVKIEDLQGKVGLVNDSYYSHLAAKEIHGRTFEHEQAHLEYQNVHKLKRIPEIYPVPKKDMVDHKKLLMGEIYATSKAESEITFKKDYFTHSLGKKDFETLARVEEFSKRAAKLKVKKKEYDDVLLHSTFSNIEQNLNRLVKKYEKKK